MTDVSGQHSAYDRYLGLDRLRVSFDGLTLESYEDIRVQQCDAAGGPDEQFGELVGVLHECCFLNDAGHFFHYNR